MFDENRLKDPGYFRENRLDPHSDHSFYLSDAARDAITDDMTAAMIKYMPLRGLVSFGGGSSEELDALVRLLNE